MASLSRGACSFRSTLRLAPRRSLRWVGAEPWWQLAMEWDARRLYPGQISVTLTRDWDRPGYPQVLTYRHRGLVVDGRTRRIPVEVQFHEVPYYDCYGLAAVDYPRVFADPGAESKHRMPDDALCLWFPADPPWRRWRHTDGLGVLLELTADHLFCEAWWRADGGDDRFSAWLGEEAPHGFAYQRTGNRRRGRLQGRSAS